MYLIGGRGQPVRTPDGMVHVITQMRTGGFVHFTACGVNWRRDAEFAPDDAAVNCMTCLVHEARE